MRLLGTLLLLAAAAGAQPPLVKDFVRLGKLRDDLQRAALDFQEKAEYASKPREEKMVIAFKNGEKKFEGKDLKGIDVVTACLAKWTDVQRDEPTEAGKRVLALLPEALRVRYVEAIDTPKDRKQVSNVLLEELDSEYFYVRVCAIDALKKIYRTQTAFMYEPSMTKKERKDHIKSWANFLKKQTK
jgi:hypothetical protein